MQNKITQYNFEGGMSNVPSDSICADGSVHAEWNLIFRNGEHNVVQDPKRLYNKKENEPDSVHILYIHTFGAETKNAIGIREDKTENKSYLVYYDHTDTAIMTSDFFTDQREIKEENVIDCTSIGQTLILNLKFDSDEYYSGLYYFLWNPDKKSYKFIGNKLPKPDMDFLLCNGTFDKGAKNPRIFKTNGQEYGDIVDFISKGATINKQTDYNNLVIGLYEKNKKEIEREKHFVDPFFVRYALELFDGSYAYISTPILMFPNISISTVGYALKSDHKVYIQTHFCSLYFKNKKSLEDWNDIVKGIAVFVSKGIDLYETDGDQPCETMGETFEVDTYDSICLDANPLITGNINIKYLKPEKEAGKAEYRLFYALNKKEESSVFANIKSTSIFYKLFTTKIYKDIEWKKVDDFIDSQKLPNLETLPQLDHDDYFGNCPLYAEGLYMYNKRLHLTKIKRGYAPVEPIHCPWNYTSTYNFVYFVHIETKEGEKIVSSELTSNQVQGFYFYYPDPRAKSVDIYYKLSNTYNYFKTLNLTPHPLLNGAYYLNDSLPTEQPKDPTPSTGTPPTISADPETLPNELWVSEVNNPFVFNASGVVTVGNGTIEGLCANTAALSPGQFGYHPMICFTTDGLWTLKVATDGTYSNAEPLSRDYCNNPKSITPTDKFIFFTSERGLMRIDGSVITPVSLQLSGKSYYPEGDDARLFYEFDVEPINFNTFLKNCKIAYDYRDNLLWITNEEYPQCFIYSIDSGAICMKPLPYPAVTIVNDFPDNIIVCKQIEISSNNSKTEHFFSYSLINRDEINLDSRRYKGFIISRPIKVEDATALKSLATHRFLFDIESNDISVRVYGSDDLKVWSRFRSFSGRGFKYYKYHIIFNNLISTDTFSGLIAEWKMKFQRKFR